MSSVDKAVEKCRSVLQYHVSPFRCYYFNPSKYTPVKLMKWSQKYVMNRMYMTLLRAAKVMEMEPIPSDLIMHNAARDGFSNRMVKIGKISFYLLKESEMSAGLTKRYHEFREKMTQDNSKRITL